MPMTLTEKLASFELLLSSILQTSIRDKNRERHTDNDMFENPIFLKINEL